MANILYNDYVPQRRYSKFLRVRFVDMLKMLQQITQAYNGMGFDFWFIELVIMFAVLW